MGKATPGGLCRGHPIEGGADAHMAGTRQRRYKEYSKHRERWWALSMSSDRQVKEGLNLPSLLLPPLNPDYRGQENDRRQRQASLFLTSRCIASYTRSQRLNSKPPQLTGSRVLPGPRSIQTTFSSGLGIVYASSAYVSSILLRPKLRRAYGFTMFNRINNEINLTTKPPC